MALYSKIFSVEEDYHLSKHFGQQISMRKMFFVSICLRDLHNLSTLIQNIHFQFLPYTATLIKVLIWHF